MARLPSAVELGGLPSASSGRQVSSIDASAIGEGMQAVGRGMMVLSRGQQAMGQGVAQGLDLAARSFKVDDDLADLQTRADFMSEKMKIDSERQNEFDPAKLDEYPRRYEALAQQYAQKFSDPRRRQKFLIETQDDVVKAGLQTQERKIGIERNNVVAGNMERLERLKREALDTKDEAEKVKRIDIGNAIYDKMARDGLIRPQEAVAAKQKWAKDYGITDFRMRSPEERLVALRGNDGALIQSESGGNPRAENKFGFLGLFQFGAPRVAHLGVYTPGAGEDLKSFNNTLANAPGKWSGTFNIPGFPNVRTKADFLANPDAQEKVYQLHQEKISQEIKANGFDKYIGQTINGVPITENGIRNMMHLGGVNSTQLFFTSGGVIDKADDNGKRLSDYARIGATAGPSKMLSILDPAERQQLLDETNRELMQKAHVAEQEQRQAAAMANAERVARNNELEVGILDGVYGPAEVMRRREMGDLTDADQMRKIDGLLRDQEKRIGSERAAVDILEGRAKLNPYDPASVDIAEAAERAIVKGSNGQISPAQASLVVFDKSEGRILTKTGAAAIRGGIESTDPEEVQRTVAVASQMLQRNPLIFNSVQGGDKIEKAANLFTHLIDNRNMNPVQAAQRVIEMQRPEYKKTIRLDETQEKSMMDDLRKNAMGDLEKATFQGSSRIPFTSNTIGFSPKQQMEASQTYAEEVIDHYREYGDLDAAKAHALKSMEKFYGVSNGVLMKYPPENIYPRDSRGSHDWLYKQAAQDIKAVSGKAVDPSNVFLIPHSVRTGEAFRAGQPAPYQVVWREEKDGQMIHHYLPLKQAFYGDIRKWISENEKPTEQQFNEARSNSGPPSLVVRPEDTRPVGIGKRVRSQAERDAEALRETEMRKQAMRNRGIALPEDAPKPPDGKPQNAEAVKAISNWWNTPLKESYKKYGPNVGPSRSRLPGKKDQ